MSKEETMERWRFDQLRLSVVTSLESVSKLMRDAEEGGNYLDSEERYHTTVKVFAVLAEGLQRSTEA